MPINSLEDCWDKGLSISYKTYSFLENFLSTQTYKAGLLKAKIVSHLMLYENLFNLKSLPIKFKFKTKASAFHLVLRLKFNYQRQNFSIQVRKL